MKWITIGTSFAWVGKEKLMTMHFATTEAKH